MELEVKTWVCICGVLNVDEFDVCQKCLRLKLSIEGWVCDFCTMKNDIKDKSCTMCKNKPKEVVAKDKNVDLNKTAQQKLKIKCFFCNTDNDISSENCSKCLKKLSFPSFAEIKSLKKKHNPKK